MSHPYRRTDGKADIIKIIVAFSNFANARKIINIYCSPTASLQMKTHILAIGNIYIITVCEDVFLLT
jgi:hypothetical protein